MEVKLAFAIFAVALATGSLLNYRNHGRQWTSTARIWLRMAALFALISAYLYLAP